MRDSTIKSLLDLDLYKLTMMQLAWKNFPDLKVKFQFINRTDIDLGKIISTYTVRRTLESYYNLSFSRDEIEYLKSLGYFEDAFLEYLKTYKLPIITVEDPFNIYTEGYWKDTILWETIVLCTVNELYYEKKYSNAERNNAKKEGRKRLQSKLHTLDAKNFPKIITEFGTRRRFSADWHDEVASVLSHHNSFSGTSNVYLAKKYGMTPVGTNAHEMYMIAAGYYGNEGDEGLVASHSYIMNQWFHMYGKDLSIGLTDTFGTDFFFRDFENKAAKWKGVRHDSGDPFVFGERVIKYYESLGIDPLTKLIVFSDGLSLEKILALYERFNKRIQFGFGWGTKLTNDLGFETLSLVMKAVEVISNGDEPINRTLVKLSDNINKHMGTPSEIGRYIGVFDYNNNYSEKLDV